MVDDLQRQVVLSVPPSRAWAAWTEQVGLWWPPSHRQFPAGRLWLEPGVGGRLVEQAPGGQEHVLGRLVVWQPPHHLAYDFFPGADPATPTRVQVWFHPQVGGGGDGTRVEVRHSPGALDPARWSGGVGRFARAWDHLLPCLTHHLSTEGASPP